MSPRLSLRPLAGREAVSSTRNGSNAPICCICSRTQAPSNSRQTRQKAFPQPRRYTAAVSPTATVALKPTGNFRRDLEAALQDLQKDAANYVNLSRIQLALRGLRQEPGRETIRIAILGLSAKDHTGTAATAKTAKEVLRLLLADPLSPAATWEKEIQEHDLSKPLVIKVGKEDPEAMDVGQIQFGSPTQQQQGGLFHELQISSPDLNGHDIEVLVMEVNSLKEAREIEEAVLVPTVDIQSGDTRYSPITTPVHKALIVGNGLLGAAETVKLPLTRDGDTITAAVNMPTYKPDETTVKSIPFTLLDIPKAEKALSVFRESLNNAIEYEHLWFESNVSILSTWLKAGSLTTADGSTKGSVLALIKSLLSQTKKRVDADSPDFKSFNRSKSPRSSKTPGLRKALENWAEKAHRELQDELEAAFAGTRWHRIGWWKLFWRVDDVGMITNELLNKHFLVEADRDVVYLAGRIEEAGVFKGTQKGYIAPKPLSLGPETVEALERRMASKKEVKTDPKTDPKAETKSEQSPLKIYTPLPQHITHTRTYLTARTVPALQALAQKLVVQTLSTTGTTSILGGLMYASDFSTESAAAVVALGLVWSLRRLQNKWESAREFWEGEVREEGRKAVRAVEWCVDDALHRGDRQGEMQVEGAEEAEKASRALERAKEALQKMK